MGYIITNRTPSALYRYFEDICAIPHGSGNESQIADYIEAFAHARGLYVYRDKNNNVLVRRPASVGYESNPPIVLQGHIDMVCEGEVECGIDFERDGLKLRLVDNLLMATGTTLGADDGVAVAIMLALLDEPELKSPTVECLFTTEEETGLTGAANFDYSKLTARRMINLDTGGEVIIVSCAGGMRTRIMSRVDTEPYSGNALTIEISGLAGGHSGVDIHLGLGNANLFLLELVEAICDVTEASIIDIHGGSKDNAIPSRCRVTLAVADTDAAVAAIAAKEAEIRDRLVDADKGMKVTVCPCSYNGNAPATEFTEKLISMTKELPIGIISYNSEIGMVETSANYAIIDVADGQFCLHLSSRSSISSALDEVGEKLETVAKKYGFTAKTDSRYEGWAYEANTPIRDAYIETYKALTGKDIPVMGIHAGLECGIIKLAVPDMDIIATGAITIGEHTTKEALDLDSFGRVYGIVKQMIEQL